MINEIKEIEAPVSLNILNTNSGLLSYYCWKAILQFHI